MVLVQNFPLYHTVTNCGSFVLCGCASAAEIRLEQPIFIASRTFFAQHVDGLQQRAIQH